jgi:hypothetical protein
VCGDDAVAVVALSVVGADAAEAWRWIGRDQFEEFQAVAVALAEFGGDGSDGVDLTGAQHADIHLGQQRQRNVVALQDARGLVRVEASLQVPGSDAQGGGHGQRRVLEQFDLVERWDRGERFGVRRRGWRQGQEAAAIGIRHGRQPFHCVAPDTDDRGDHRGPAIRDRCG